MTAGTYLIIQEEPLIVKYEFQKNVKNPKKERSDNKKCLPVRKPGGKNQNNMKENGDQVRSSPLDAMTFLYQ